MSDGVRVRKVLFVLLISSSVTAVAADYRCTVERKVDFNNYEYTAAQLKKFKFSNLVEETEEGSFVSRCSFAPSKGEVTCDRYKVDRVDVDPSVKIKKLYVFRSQFNLQIFPSLDFIEDNGRGSVSYGRCQIIAP
ncbi:hypothetical protein F0U61_11435 [Archangium violaceum]|uniref:hypothetical protein n=1 Tax=Archangium violaceum TaxID=83451 RepID=UPI002B2CD0B0|nr:hypothetical protein F0U61_11435 [Archangium violaceum]